MTSKTWQVRLDGKAQTISVEHDASFKNRIVRVNGRLIDVPLKATSSISDLAFRLENHFYIISIRPKGDDFMYDLNIDGRSLEEALRKRQKAAAQATTQTAEVQQSTAAVAATVAVASTVVESPVVRPGVAPAMPSRSPQRTMPASAPEQPSSLLKRLMDQDTQVPASPTPARAIRPVKTRPTETAEVARSVAKSTQQVRQQAAPASAPRPSPKPQQPPARKAIASPTLTLEDEDLEALFGDDTQVPTHTPRPRPSSRTTQVARPAPQETLPSWMVEQPLYEERPAPKAAYTPAPMMEHGDAKLFAGRPLKQVEEKVRPSMPGWAYLFIVACGAIPILSLGGVIPGAVGFGGASICASIARSPQYSMAHRFVMCVMITAACWGAMIAMFGGIVMLSANA
jgi:hypothetical protein